MNREPQHRALRIATFVTDEHAYQEMAASFTAAGFGGPLVTYERLSDAQENPYGAIRRLGRAHEPYVLLVHQDVRCDQGDGMSELRQALEELCELDDSWAIAGNAGGMSDLALVKHVSDPWGTSWAASLPREVVTLDEDLLVLRTAASPSTSAALSGFHLYGSDACLNARARGGRCYVIDFRVTHLSGGNRDGYEEAALALATAWSARSWFSYLRSSNSVIFLSRVPLLRRLFGAARLRTRLELGRFPLALYTALYCGWLS